MKDLDEFMPSILPYAPGCAAPTAYFAIRQAAIEFCERTRLWKYEGEITLATDGDQAITTPADSVLHDIDVAKFDGKDLTPKTLGWLDEHYPTWRDGEATGTPSYITQVEPDTLVVVPFATGELDIRLILKPSQDCTQVPDFLPDQYREVIAHGALARILMMPGQPFSNPNSAAAFAMTFGGRVDFLSRRGTSGQQRARTRTKAQFM